MPGRLAKIYFMMSKFFKDISRDRQIYELSDDLHSPKLGEYYFIMTEEQMLSGHSQQYHFDGEGIPIIPTYIDVEQQRMIHYPISIGQYGLAIWHTYLQTRRDQDKQRFLKIADWFLTNRIEDEKLGVYWLTDVDKPAYRIQRPWKSAFTQARAINIFLRAFQLTGNLEYELYAEKALYPFLFSVKDGGVVTNMPEGQFYEEYPAEVPVLVLNGMIFSLCGIYDFIRTHRGHQMSEAIFDDGVKALRQLLPRYDMGFWSKYCLCNADFHPAVDPATIGYHHLHIIQLRLMHKLTGETIFEEYATHWEQYVNLKNILKMYQIKYQALRKMNRL